MTKAIALKQKATCIQRQDLLSNIFKLYNYTFVGLQKQVTEIPSGNWYFKIDVSAPTFPTKMIIYIMLSFKVQGFLGRSI